MLAFFAVVGGAVFVLRPVASAVAKRISGEHRSAPPGFDPAEQDEILNELQALRQELTELSERMDFAERLLAKQQRDIALPKPGPG